MTETLDHAIELEMLGSWHDVTADVRDSAGIMMDRGLPGPDTTDGVAPTGTLRFALDNSESNSSKNRPGGGGVGLVGFYSPGHPDCRMGFEEGIRVRQVLRLGGESIVKFLGVLEDVDIVPGDDSPRLVMCSAVDFMDELARAFLSSLPAQVRKRSDEVISTIIAGMARQPEAITIGEGRDTFDFALDQSAKATALGLCQRVIQSEPGALLYMAGDSEEGGRLTYEPRHARIRNWTSAATFTPDLYLSTNPSRNRNKAINRVQLTVHPRRVDAEQVTLFSLDKPVAVRPNQTITIRGPYRDPEQTAKNIGGLKSYDAAGVGTGSVMLEADDPIVEFNTREDGQGVLIPTYSASWVFGADAIELTFTSGPQSGFITRFDVFGFGIYDYAPIPVVVEDAANQAATGVVNEIKFDMPYQGDAAKARGIAQYLLALHGPRQTRLSSITIEGNTSAWLMEQAIRREISDRITIQENVSGVLADYFINAISLKIHSQGKVLVTWTLAPADPVRYFTLDLSQFDGTHGLLSA